MEGHPDGNTERAHGLLSTRNTPLSMSQDHRHLLKHFQGSPRIIASLGEYWSSRLHHIADRPRLHATFFEGVWVDRGLPHASVGRATIKGSQSSSKIL
jgi:hypothetical protein